MNTNFNLDYTCLIHGKKMSEHQDGICLYCCLCYKPLTISQCHTSYDGHKEDVCLECAANESAAFYEI